MLTLHVDSTLQYAPRHCLGAYKLSPAAPHLLAFCLKLLRPVICICYAIATLRQGCMLAALPSSAHGVCVALARDCEVDCAALRLCWLAPVGTGAGSTLVVASSSGLLLAYALRQLVRVQVTHCFLLSNDSLCFSGIQSVYGKGWLPRALHVACTRQWCFWEMGRLWVWMQQYLACLSRKAVDFFKLVLHVGCVICVLRVAFGGWKGVRICGNRHVAYVITRLLA